MNKKKIAQFDVVVVYFIFCKYHLMSHRKLVQTEIQIQPIVAQQTRAN